MGEAFQRSARNGIRFLVSYIGSAFLHVHELYGARIKLVLSSWNAVQKTEAYGSIPLVEEKEEKEEVEKVEKEEVTEAKVEEGKMVTEMKIPSNFNEMLLFNASVMGYGASEWMKIMLLQFDDMVRSVANFTRLQEDHTAGHKVQA